jgi:hypothetical protein
MQSHLLKGCIVCNESRSGARIVLGDPTPEIVRLFMSPAD